MTRLTSVVLLSSLITCPALSQAAVSIPLKIRLGDDSTTVYFGFDYRASYCLDPSLGETEVPPAPFEAFDVRFIDPRGWDEGCLGFGTYTNFRPWSSGFGLDTLFLSFVGPYDSTKWKVSWPSGLDNCLTRLELKDAIAGFFDYDMLKIYSVDLPNSFRSWYIIYYTILEDVRSEPKLVLNQPELKQNFPNPFNPSTTIRFDLPNEATVTLKVYNIFGQEVVTLAEERRFAVGENSVEFDAANLPSGIYYYRLMLDRGKYQEIKKMILLR